MPPAYGLAALVVLVIALIYVRSVANRRRRPARRRVSSRGMRSLSQRSEMRAAEDPSTVMEEMQRTQSRGRPAEPASRSREPRKR